MGAKKEGKKGNRGGESQNNHQRGFKFNSDSNANSGGNGQGRNFSPRSNPAVYRRRA